MFLMIGIEEGRKEFDYSRTAICKNCGRYGRLLVFMTFTSLLLFFIPCFKWNKQYYVQMSCCGKFYRLNSEVGKQIARGEDVEIRPEDLEPVAGWQNNGGWQNNSGWQNNGGWPNYHNEYGDSNNSANSYRPKKRRCFYCGFETDEDFDYCPKCGRKF